MSGRLDAPAISALGLIAAGIEAILNARTAEGWALIDEAILPLLADQVPIEWAGDIYCMVLHHCHKLADLPRMRAWTQSMEQWCGVSGSVPYGAVCDVHRLQVQAATDDYRGSGGSALDLVSRALEEVNAWAAAEGYYQLGEVRRLLGDFDGAATAFGRPGCSAWIRSPVRRCWRCRRGDTPGRGRRSGSRSPAVTGWPGLDCCGPRSRSRWAAMPSTRPKPIAVNWKRTPKAFATPGYLAWAAHARGAVAVRRGQFAPALESLQTALRQYRVQQSRYETAEVYEWMALAQRGLGAREPAAADAATAEAIYAQLGVEPAGICGTPSPGGLTRRELEVLAYVARGATNRQVAQQLHLSDKTVGRHLANVYAKIGVSTRTAAANWARENNVLHHLHH